MGVVSLLAVQKIRTEKLEAESSKLEAKT